MGGGSNRGRETERERGGKREREREERQRERGQLMEPVFYLSLDNYLCLPQTSSGALNQGAGAWVFVQAGCVCACACTRRASCRPQHSPTAIRLKPCCCGAWLSSLLQGLQLTLNPRLHNDCPSHTEVFTHETNVPTHSNAHAHTHINIYIHTLFHLFQKWCVWPLS